MKLDTGATAFSYCQQRYLQQMETKMGYSWMLMPRPVVGVEEEERHNRASLQCADAEVQVFPKTEKKNTRHSVPLFMRWFSAKT